MSARSAAVLLAAALTLGGCGSSERSGARIRGRTLTIYFSGPLHGASSPGATATLNGARLALAAFGSRIGEYRIALRALDDSTPQSRGWDPNQTTLNARLAAQDPTAIGYLGEFNSGASAVAIPLLNRAGIPQISAGSTAVGLTTAGPGASPGEPEKYYPTGTRTFIRMVPSDIFQASALVKAQQAAGCQSTFVFDDGEVDGEDTALTFVLTAQSLGLRVVGIQAFSRGAPDYSALARSLAGTGADCVLISAIDEPSAVLLTEQVAHALPRATMFATNGLAESLYVDPAKGGIPKALDPRMLLVSATLGPTAYPAAARIFLAAYARRFGPPEPPAIFGYEAMRLLLAAVRRATDAGHKPAERSKVRSELFSAHRRNGPLGGFRIDSAGEATLRRFGVYRIVHGRLSFLYAGG